MDKHTGWNIHWDVFCAACDKGMSWVLRVLARGLRKRPQNPWKPRRIILAVEGLEQRQMLTATPVIVIGDAPWNGGNPAPAIALIGPDIDHLSSTLEGLAPDVSYGIDNNPTAPAEIDHYDDLSATFAGTDDYSAVSIDYSYSYNITKAPSGLSILDIYNHDVSGALAPSSAAGPYPYTSNPIPFTAHMTNIVNPTSSSSLDGVSASLSYFDSDGNPLGEAPTNLGAYSVEADFTGSTHYTSAEVTTDYTIGKATPTVSVSDSGGIYNGGTFPAIASVTGVSGTPGSSLEGTSLALTYKNSSGTTLSGAPSAPGTYSVKACFAGSTDYYSANSTITFTISKVHLSVTGVTATKTYDRNTTAPLNVSSASLSGVVSGDTVTLSSGGASGTFASANASSSVGVTTSGFTISGAQAGYYCLNQPTLTGSIAPKLLTIIGVSAYDKPYDGNTNAALSVSGAYLSGVISGDSVTLGGGGSPGTFASMNAGTNIAVTPSPPFGIGGAQVGNYTLASLSLTASITKVPTSISVSPSISDPSPNTPVTLSAVLAYSGSGIPTGSIIFKDGSTTLQTVSLTLTTTNTSALYFSAGSHTITAVYSGDTNYITSTSESANVFAGNPNVVVGSAGTDCNCGCPGDLGTISENVAGAGANVKPKLGLSAMPVRYSDGVVDIAATDLMSNGFGAVWGQTRSWTNGPGYADGSVNGVGWKDTRMPSLMEISGTSVIAEISNGMTAQNFNSPTTVGIITTYQPGNFDQSTFVYNSSTDKYVMTDESGNQVTFYGFSTSLPAGQRGQFASLTDADGNVTSVTSHNSAGAMTEIQRSSGSQIESWLYSYVPIYNPNVGLLSNVTLRRSTNSGSTWTSVQQVDYTYYNGQTHGNLGDLMTATLEDGSGTATGTYYYRYYTPAEIAGGAHGFVHGLEFNFTPDSEALLVGSVGSSLDSFSNSQVAPYADNYFEYDSSLRASKEVAQGAGSSSASPAGLGTFIYNYTTSSNSAGYNSWAVKTVETLPDSNENIVYTNAYGEVMLSVFHDTTTNQKWDTFYEYDSQGRALLKAAPSAVTGYDDSYADLLHKISGNYGYLADSAGLVTVYDYAASTTATSTTAGNVLGYQLDLKIQQGETGTAITQEAWTYFNCTAGGVTVNPVATDTVYRNTDGTGGETTSYAYTWFSGTVRMQSETVSAAVVTTTQNGPNTADVTTTYFDTYGRPIWSMDPDGYLTYVAYDPATGAVTKNITDVDTSITSEFANKPSGWSTPSGGGLNLVTTFQLDGRGRTTKETDPNGHITYTIYDDANQEIRVYPGWNTTTSTPTGPTIVTRNDRANGYTETLTMTATPHLTSSLPDGTEAIGSLQSLERDYRDSAGQVVTMDRYFNLAGLTYGIGAMGTSGTNFYVSQNGYDDGGTPNKVVSATGTITRTVSDGLGRKVSVWIGTNDTPTSGSWSPANPAGMTQVAAYQYDGGGVGDSNLTQVTLIPGGGAANRVTQNFYDWRDRLVASKDGVQSSESTSVNRPITYYTYDNLNMVTSVSVYDGDTISISSSSGVPNAPSSSLLRAYATAAYDNQGRVYEAKVFDVDQSSGSISSSALTTTNNFYDHRGNLIEKAPSGGVVSKMVHDGAGRLTVSYTSDGGGDSGWADAATVTGDLVYLQKELTYDADSNVIQTTTRERWDGQTATGALANSSTTPKARVSYAGAYFDLSNRPTAIVNVGTNGNSSWTLPGSVPSRSDSVLVTSIAYDNSGFIDTTDPRGLDSRTYFDPLGRVVKTIKDYTNGTPTANSNQTMAYTYDGSNHILTATAVLPSSAAEVTQFVYGVTTSGGSGITSNDILEEVRHPDPVTGSASTSYKESYTVDALGATLTHTDQNGHTSSFGYNVLGQEISVTDALTHATTMAYDARGNLASVTDPLSQTTSYAHDGLGRVTVVTDPLSHTTTTAYDTRGNVSSVTDALSHTTSYSYDALHRETQMTDALSHSTTWAYNVSGNESTITDAANTTNNSANVTTFVVDDFGRQSEVIDPASHTTSNSYDRDNKLTSKTDRDGRVIDYTYDNLGRETGQTWYTSTARTTTSETLSYTYDAANNLLTAGITDGTNTYSYTMTYDKQNRITAATEPFGVSLSFGYDYVGNRTSVADSFGGTETSVYNAVNQLTNRTFSKGSTDIQVQLDYYANGQLAEQRNYADISVTPIPEITLTDYTYYADGRIDTIVEKDANGGTTPTNSVNSFSYSYDNADRLTSKTENSTTTSYAYDNTNQITGVNGTTLYSYDATGGSSASGVNVTTGNQLQTDGTWNYIYDNEGNVTQKTISSTGETWTYGYDNKNELISTTHKPTTSGSIDLTVAYVYDALGNRIEKDVTQSGTTTVTRFAMDLWKNTGSHLVGNENADVWADLSGSSSLTTRYMHGDAVDQVFARMAYASSTYSPYWYLTDNLGSIRDVVDNTGHVVDAIGYGVFGNITSETSSGNRGLYAWTGRELDVETNLQYNRARYYDSSTHRWMSQDPLGFDAGDSNLYRYVKNRPTVATDPSGKDIILLMDPTAKVPVFGTVGHPAVLVGNDKDGWQYFSFHGGDPSTTDDNLVKKSFKTLADAKKDAEVNAYSKFIRYKTNKAADDLAKKEALSWDKTRYDLATHNCSIFVYWVTKRAGVRLPTYRVAPGYNSNSWFDALDRDAKTNGIVIDQGKWGSPPTPRMSPQEEYQQQMQLLMDLKMNLPF